MVTYEATHLLFRPARKSALHRHEDSTFGVGPITPLTPPLVGVPDLVSAPDPLAARPFLSSSSSSS